MYLSNVTTIDAANSISHRGWGDWIHESVDGDYDWCERALERMAEIVWETYPNDESLSDVSEDSLEEIALQAMAETK